MHSLSRPVFGATLSCPLGASSTLCCTCPCFVSPLWDPFGFVALLFLLSGTFSLSFLAFFAPLSHVFARGPLRAFSLDSSFSSAENRKKQPPKLSCTIAEILHENAMFRPSKGGTTPRERSLRARTWRRSFSNFRAFLARVWHPVGVTTHARSEHHRKRQACSQHKWL